MLTPPLLEMRGIAKGHGGLRPLRVAELGVSSGEVVTVEGPDEAAAAVLVDLVTGTTLPDTGDVIVAGRSTADIGDQDAWLGFLDQFGIVNSRVVLLDELTVLQNVAVPLTLDVDPLGGTARTRALELAAAVGLEPGLLEEPLARVAPLGRFRVRLARAVVHDPQLLLVEHPSLALDPGDVGACAAALRSAARRATAALVVTADDRLAAAVATRRLAWQASTGRLTERRGWRRWLRR